jgi:hypothetical protein
MIVNPGTTVVARNPTTVARREDGLKAVTATAKTREKAAAAKSAIAVVSSVAGIHQARGASIKVGRAIMKAGNAIVDTAIAKTKVTT